MRTAEVEVFSDAVNSWIIRTEGRSFPAIVIQGDNLRYLYSLASKVSRLADLEKNDELSDVAGQLLDELKERIEYYESVLLGHRLELPYSGRVTNT